MAGTFRQKIAGPAFQSLTLRGRFLGFDGSGNAIMQAELGLSPLNNPVAFRPAAYLPRAPVIGVTMPSRTSATVTIAPSLSEWPRARVSTWDVYRNEDGGEYALVQSVPRTTLSWTDTGLPTSTPDILFRYYVLASSADGPAPPSNIASVQWTSAPAQQPTAPTMLAVSGVQQAQVTLTWQETADATVDKHGIFVGTTLLVDGISASVTTYNWTGLTSLTTYSNINVRRHNSSGVGPLPGWSGASNTVQFKTTGTTMGPLFLGHVRGKMYLGWSSNEDDATAEAQLNTQVPKPAGAPSSYSDLLGIRRLYNKDTSIISRADTNRRVLWISGKSDEFGSTAGVPGWSQVASGAYDAGIRSYFSSLVARNKLTVFTFHHEPIGDTNASNAQADQFCQAFLRIMQVVDQTYPGHRIIFCPNYEENRLRNLKIGGVNLDWSHWLPEDMLPGLGGERPWDLMSFDMYQYNANTSTNTRSGVQFSHRWWRIDELFAGTFLPNGSSAMPWLNYTPGVDMVYGIGECAMRPGTFYWHESGGGSQTSDMTGVKYTRDMFNYLFANLDKFAFISWFNSIGADPTYNDERLYPDANSWGSKTPNHPSLVQQTGDTEYAINIYREKLAGGMTTKLTASGLP